VAVGIALVTIAWLGMRSQRGPAPTQSRRYAGTPSELLEDSLHAAERVRQWQRSFAFASELSGREPRNARYLLLLAQSWNNLAWGGSAFGRERAPLRTSSARVRAFGRALTLLDSASGLARDPATYGQICLRVGQIYETEGLPIDALVVYQAGLVHVPEDSLINLRAAWVMSQLNDPLRSDAERGHPVRRSVR